MKPFRAAAAIVLFFALTVLAAPRADACISCEYKPEVTQSKPTPKIKASNRAQKVRQQKVVKERPQKPKNRFVKKKEPVVEETAKAEPAKSEPAKSPDVEKTTASKDADPPTTEGPAKSSATALAHPNSSANEQADPVEATGSCKKFSATAGKTVTVPC